MDAVVGVEVERIAERRRMISMSSGGRGGVGFDFDLLELADSRSTDCKAVIMTSCLVWRIRASL